MKTIFYIFVAAAFLGVGIAQATMHYVFPEPRTATQGYDSTWTKCPGKKPVRVGKQKYYWYCGPEQRAFVVANDTAGGTGAGAAKVDAGAASRRTKKGSSGSRSVAAGGR